MKFWNVGVVSLKRVTVGIALSAGILSAGPAHARNCYLERQRHVRPGQSYSVAFKVKAGAICEYKYRNGGRFTYEGVTITQKPAGLVAKTNEYGLAFSIPKPGTYTLGYTVQTSQGPFSVTANVEVVGQAF